MGFSSSYLGTVLVVDERSESAQQVQQFLDRHHYQVYFTGSDDPVSQAANSTPDLILLDADLFGVEALELCRYLKSTVPYTPLVVILPTGITEWWDALEAGADDVLTQPLEEDSLFKCVTVMRRVRRHLYRLQEKNTQLNEELTVRTGELRRALEESHQLSVLKDSIVRNVSHELRTPLLHMKSAVTMMADDARASNNNGSERLVNYALQATARLESVVQNITQLAASMNVKLEAFRMVDAVSVALRQLGRQWESSRGVDRIRTLIQETPPVVGDRNAVAQVLQQLLDNALKFSPDGGEIEVIVEQTANETVWIAVRDRGIGIAEDQRERIFQAFYQVDSSSTRRFGGTGVGLAIVKLILDALSTKIHVQSEPGVGSTFGFMLPLAKVDSSSEVAANQTEPVH